MKEIAVISIPGDVYLLSPNHLNGLHWSYHHKAKSKAREAAVWCWVKAGSPSSDKQVTVSIHSWRARRMDEDNLIASLKAYFDGLFKGGITPDDGPDWVKLGRIEQTAGLRFKGRERVEITIEAED